MPAQQLTQEDLALELHYAPDVGSFTRIATGLTVGCPSANGYLRCRVHGRIYFLHRLAFLAMTGEFPPGDVDHIDGNRGNNAWSNLRAATRSGNCQNRTAATTARSGVRNVYFDPQSGRWQVKVMVDGRSKSFGYFATIEEATPVARAAEAKLHTFHPVLTR